MTYNPAAGGGVSAYNCRVDASGAQTLPTTVGNLITLGTELAILGTAITWNGANKEFEINETGIYKITWFVSDNSGSVHSMDTNLSRDTGGGHAPVAGTQTLNGGNVTRCVGAGSVTLSLNAGDTIAFSVRVTTAITATIVGAGMTLLKLS